MEKEIKEIKEILLEIQQKVDKIFTMSQPDTQPDTKRDIQQFTYNRRGGKYRIP
jgi:hypothetical protein